MPAASDIISPLAWHRCYAPTLELSKWECDFPQTVALSSSFSTTSPILMDQPIADKCYLGFGTLKNATAPNSPNASDIDVYPSCIMVEAPDLHDGSYCGYNQQAGVCTNGSCIVAGGP